MEGPKIDPYIYGQLNFDKGVKTTQWRRGFSINDAAAIGYHMQKNELDPLSYQGVNLECILKLNIRANAMNFFRLDYNINLCNESIRHF